MDIKMQIAVLDDFGLWFQQARRVRLIHPIAIVLLLAVVSPLKMTISTARAQKSTGTDSMLVGKKLLTSGTALYPRVIRLAYSQDHSINGELLVSVTAITRHGSEEDFYTTRQGVAGFTKLSVIRDDTFAHGLCCGTLYELPSRVGTMEAGTVLWAGSAGQESLTAPMQLKIFASRDGGRNWRYLSDCAKSNGPRKTVGGLWEPQFTVAKDGALVCFYSDETEEKHSQVIKQTRTYDGVHWLDTLDTLAGKDPRDRPGMAVVTRLPNGLYFMTFEVCGPAACSVSSRTSTDGWSWGDSTDLDQRVVSTSGQWFEHAPTNVWSSLGIPGKGTIIVVGQVLFESNGTLSKENGLSIFADQSGTGSGPWTAIKAPVPVPDARNNYCPNYSSALLPSNDGQDLLEVASDYDGSVCSMYYAAHPISVLEAASGEWRSKDNTPAQEK
jgi:hypothetical protein